ncbi:hypothetical protein MKW98_012051 [Papaver atlanticum]|uniref:Uncharacterized protein n=1 Tax=Papaver atlanticum TaxID=357466 RepID=A0AAD4XHY9_9MAGN|nr:hypothetical protein MKW98_012051 [Papaver atlanticum]
MDKSRKLYTVDLVHSPKAAGKGGISSSEFADFLSDQRKPDPYFTEILSKRSNHCRSGLLRTIPCRNQGKAPDNFRGLLEAQRKKKHLEALFKDEFEAKCKRPEKNN